MKKLIVLFVAIACISCGRKTKTRSIPTPELIANRAQVYALQLPQVQDEHGFIDTDRCDATLFSGLLSAAGAVVDMEAAEASPGEWLRRPTSYPECYANGESRSTISRDMLLGVMFHAYFKRDVDMLDRLFEYGESNLWRMGRGDGTEIFTPNDITLLARLSYKLGGPDRFVRNLPLIIGGSDCQGFTCHLSVLYLILAGEANDGLTESQIDILETISRKNPQNALYTAVALKYGRHRPWNINWQLYPENRLPDTTDRCSRWVTERDDDDRAFAPCPDQSHVHSGGELIFVNWVLREL